MERSVFRRNTDTVHRKLDTVFINSLSDSIKFNQNDNPK